MCMHWIALNVFKLVLALQKLFQNNYHRRKAKNRIFTKSTETVTVLSTSHPTDRQVKIAITSSFSAAPTSHHVQETRASPHEIIPVALFEKNRFFPTQQVVVAFAHFYPWKWPMFDQYLLNELSQEGGTGRVLKLLMRRIHIFDDFMKIRWRGDVGSPMRCTKMDQNGPKWSPYHDRAKVFQIRPE